MKSLSESFFIQKIVNILTRAFCDLVFLLDRDYPKKSALTFVANHYNLETKYRNVLERAALSSEEVQLIQSHLITEPTFLRDKVLHIDTYNQLTTFYSLENHDPLIICRDGVIRDIFSSIHVKKDLKLHKELVIAFIRALSQLSPDSLIFYFDRQRSQSKNHANLFQMFLHELNIMGSCEVQSAVDWKLKSVTKGVVLSHDSIILKAAPSCFDFILWYLNLKFPASLYKQVSINFSEVSYIG